jgi:hypothetical protein
VLKETHRFQALQEELEHKDCQLEVKDFKVAKDFKELLVPKEVHKEHKEQ